MVIIAKGKLKKIFHHSVSPRFYMVAMISNMAMLSVMSSIMSIPAQHLSFFLNPLPLIFRAHLTYPLTKNMHIFMANKKFQIFLYILSTLFSPFKICIK